MKRTKWVNISTLDILNLQNFLNEQARLGWEVRKITPYRIVFEYVNESDKVYWVTNQLYLSSIYPDVDDIQQQKEFENFINEYDYEFVARVSELEIYAGHSEVPLFSDRESQEEMLYKIGEKSLKQYAVLSGLWIVLIVFLVKFFNPVRFLLSNTAFLIFFIILVGLSYTLYKSIKGYRFTKGKAEWKSYKFNSIKTDWVTIFSYLLALILFISYVYRGLYSSSSTIFYMIFAFAAFALRKYLYEKEMPKSQKMFRVLVLTLPLYILLMISRNSLTGLIEDEQGNDKNILCYRQEDFEAKKCMARGDSSFLGSYIDYYCSGNDSSVLLLEHEFMRDELKARFIEDNEFFRRNKIVEGDDFVIMSDKPIDPELIKLAEGRQ